MNLFQSNRQSGHFLVLGSTRAGKSALFADLMTRALSSVSRHQGPEDPIKDRSLYRGDRRSDAKPAPPNAHSDRTVGRDSPRTGS